MRRVSKCGERFAKLKGKEMAKSIETRIEQLEKKSSVGLPRVVMHIVPVSALDAAGHPFHEGELLGYGGVKRIPGESEEALFERVEKAALAATKGNVLLIEDRAPTIAQM